MVSKYNYPGEQVERGGASFSSRVAQHTTGQHPTTPGLAGNTVHFRGLTSGLQHALTDL